MPATCPNCGREIGRRDRFCDACGAFLGWDAGASSADSQLLQRPPPRDDQRAAVQIQLRTDLIEVAPGNAESTAFTVKNLGTQVEEFRFFVTGPEWIAVEPAAISVYPGQEGTGAVQAAPPRKPGSAAGVTPFRLTVTSALHAHVSSSVAGRVDVAGYYEWAAELVPTSSNGRGLTRHHVELNNRGNVPLRIALGPTDVADGLRLGVPAFADVAPGQVIEVPVSVYGTRRWFGRPEPKTFSIVAEPPKPLAVTRLSGTRIVVPLFPRWVPAAAAGLAAAAVAGAVLVPKLMANDKPLSSSSTLSSSPPPGASASSGPSSSGPSSSGPSSSSSSPSSSAPSTTGSSSASQVPVPEVAGETLQLADSTLKDAHLVPQNIAFYDSSSPGSTNVVRTNPAANAVVSTGSPVQVFVPIQHYDMIAAATQAQWTATSQVTPPSATVPAGTQTGTAGQVFVLTPATLEDNSVASQALETVPPPVQGYTISGRYELGGPSIAQEMFRADLGFRQGTPTGESIRYQVVAIVNGSSTVVDGGTHDSGSGQVVHLEHLLPVGTTAVVLKVTVLDATTTLDQILWAAPLIEESNASPPPDRPKASVSPSAPPGS